MPRLAISRLTKQGFTMVELLVTLVLLGLISAVAAPGLEAWMASRQAATERAELASRLLLLPIQASQQRQSLSIHSAKDLAMPDVELQIEQPVSVLANGYCLGGRVAIVQGPRRFQFDVLPPFCELRARSVE
ncbi:prepilin-type N-terminal cleavage/methylation domain-containing protein [Bowmanella denitrificans]|uniref:prepilin-type N-terminal cleavage/methylation domain-containing protein n=1 Tax=Bowmanella denitrificans TaxID=366582 RepID=UPI000C9AC31D|nr:prepilin-type N-terminal cleavage/methylation domain-containing protein [Bowmanella denitrificans]